MLMRHERDLGYHISCMDPPLLKQALLAGGIPGTSVLPRCHD